MRKFHSFEDGYAISFALCLIKNQLSRAFFLFLLSFFSSSAKRKTDEFLGEIARTRNPLQVDYPVVRTKEARNEVLMTFLFPIYCCSATRVPHRSCSTQSFRVRCGVRTCVTVILRVSLYSAIVCYRSCNKTSVRSKSSGKTDLGRLSATISWWTYFSLLLRVINGSFR